ncbi:hypothetical protein RDABS01_012847 [Bienertia sinuspersici]
MGGQHAQHIANLIGYDGHTRVNTQGFSGGIWVYWKTNEVTVEPIRQHNQYIVMEVSRIGTIPWYFTAVYASPDPTKHSELWRELKDFASLHNKPWLITGDFNETSVENAKIIQTGASVAIGNGAKTLLWDHAWVTEDPLINQAHDSIPDECLGATVQEMWEVGVGWKWDKFAHYLPNKILKQIASHELVENPKIGDLLYWKGTSNGKFSIKHALKLIRNDNPPTFSDQWNVIWKTPVQQRIRAFIWVLMHGRLLYNVNRVKRNLSDDPTCPRCHQAEESNMHLFRDCPQLETFGIVLEELLIITLFIQVIFNNGLPAI